MRVRSILLVSLASAILLMCVLFVAAWGVASQLDRQGKIQSRAVEISGQVSRLLVLTNEYALHGEARVVDQWRTTQKKIVIGLEVDQQSATPAPAEAAEQARMLSIFFNQLVEPDPGRDAGLEARRARLLINKLLTQTQAFFDTVDRWGDSARELRFQLESRFRSLFVAMATVMLLILVALVALIWLRVLLPLTRLHAAVRALTDGNLDARCNLATSDEFGDLSRSFDTMAEVQQKSDIALRESKNFMALVIDEIPGMVGYWTKELVCTFANMNYYEWFGKSKEQMIGIRIQDLLGEELFRKNESFILAALEGERQQFERSIVKADGSVGHGWTHYVPDWEGEQVKGFFVLFSDVTEIKLAQQAVATAELFARTTIDTMPETICVLDKTGVIIGVNQSWRDFYDANFQNPQSINYAVGTNYLQVCESATGSNTNEAPQMADGLASVLRGERDNFSIEYPCDSPSEKRFFVARVTRFPGESGHVLVAHGNITHYKTLELELAHMAHTDVLTGLNNRRHFIELSETELSRTARHGGALSLLMLDIDHFKRVNDTYGHKVGDQVIQVLAAVCREQLRELDVIGRLGGEEFAVTMPNTDHAQAIQVAERLRLAIETASVPLSQGLPLRFTASIGVTTLPDSPINLETLLEQADQSLYKAKNNGRNQVCSYIDAAPIGAASSN